MQQGDIELNGLNLDLARWEEFKEAIWQFGVVLTEHLQKVFEQIKPVLDQFWAALWEIYREAGMPYGESDEGLMRWARECAEAERLKREAERTLERHRELVAFRERLRRIHNAEQGDRNDH